MNQRTMILFPLLLGLVFTGCATTASYETILNSWVGHDINDLVKSWGYPTNTFKAPNGNTVYAYERAAAGVSPTYTAPTQTNVTVIGNTAYGTTTGGQTYGGHPYTNWCKTFFETNDSKQIITWRWEGNSCRQ